ncbi:MAG: 2,4'-dihydroxyacetophenone dioxygenase family protein [Pseudomonadota bacterium]
MNDMTLQQTDDAAPVNALMTLPYPEFTRGNQIPWKPWVMDGIEYKLLATDHKTNGFTCLLKVAPGTVAPVHQHIGAIEVYIIDGEIYYEDSDKGAAGDYIYEPAGDIHRPYSPEGCLLFAVFHGPIAGLDDDGNMAGIVDAKAMEAMATEHGTISMMANTHPH